MELRQLKYFLAVADTRSFVNAANNLYVSRQAISKAISQLEEELKVELFMRNSNGAFLTPAGVMLYDRVRSIVMELGEIGSDMQNYGDRYRQRLRLAFAVGTTQIFERPLLDYQIGQVNVVVEYQECTEDQCFALLTEHKADVAICTTLPLTPQFVAEEIFRSPMGVLLYNRENVAEMEHLELSDLKWLPLAGVLNGQNLEFCQKYGFRLHYSGYDYRRLLALTKAERCALLIPECLAPKKDPKLCWLPLENTEWWRVYQVHLKQMEKNILYRTALDELQYHVLENADEGWEDSL